jgi:four helix bundle protein
MSYNGFRDLKVWQRAIDVAVEVYRLTQTFPSNERFGLTAQMRRAAVSVPSNIAEGHGRTTRGEYANQLSVARGSLKELETLSEIARLLSFIDEVCHTSLQEQCAEISKMLTVLKRKIDR